MENKKEKKNLVEILSEEDMNGWAFEVAEDPFGFGYSEEDIEEDEDDYDE